MNKFKLNNNNLKQIKTFLKINNNKKINSYNILINYKSNYQKQIKIKKLDIKN